MSQAFLTRRGGSGAEYATIKFENYNSTSKVKHYSINLIEPRDGLAATTIGDYALFAGGTHDGPLSTVETYNTSQTRSIAPDLSLARYFIAATTIGDYALFAGGSISGDSGSTDAYNSSLTRSTATSLSVTRSYLAATTIGNYALFGGGIYNYNGTSFSSYSTVDSYNKSLTRSTATSLNVARSHLAATTIGNYALFGGGYGGTSNTNTINYSTVDSYNKSLTRSTATSLSVARSYLAATTVGDYALFGGGYNSEDYSVVVDAYNSSLTRSTPTQLSQKRRNLAATTLGERALFGGGDNFEYGRSGTVESYNTSLGRGFYPDLIAARASLAATTLAGYALFAGGKEKSLDSSFIDVYSYGSIFSVYPGSKYKFQNMESEVTADEYREIAIPSPATGYIKIKSIEIS